MFNSLTDVRKLLMSQICWVKDSTAFYDTFNTLKHASVYNYHHSQYNKMDPDSKSNCPHVVMKKIVVPNNQSVVAVLFK